jgi:hypothetical protein
MRQPWRGSGRPHGGAKLTLWDAAVIFALKGVVSSRRLAAMFHVGKTTVLDIWHGKTWRSQ